MPQQMSLFPEKNLTNQNELSVEGELNALDEMFAANHRFRTGKNYMDMLEFITRFANYSPFNGFLLYTQNTDITHVATAGVWLRRFKRRPKFNARPLIILAPMSPVRFVYDIADTDGEPVTPDRLKTLSRRERLTEDVLERTVHNCAVHGILVREIVLDDRAPQSAIQLSDDIRSHYEALKAEARMNYLILLNSEHSLNDRYAALVYELGRIFCGHNGAEGKAWWPDRRDIDPAVKEIEVDTVAFLACRRKGLVQNAARYLTGYRSNDLELPLPGFSGVLQATHYIENMARSRWKKPRKTA